MLLPALLNIAILNLYMERYANGFNKKASKQLCIKRISANTSSPASHSWNCMTAVNCTKWNVPHFRKPCHLKHCCAVWNMFSHLSLWAKIIVRMMRQLWITPLSHGENKFPFAQENSTAGHWQDEREPSHRYYDLCLTQSHWEEA